MALKPFLGTTWNAQPWPRGRHQLLRWLRACLLAVCILASCSDSWPLSVHGRGAPALLRTGSPGGPPRARQLWLIRTKCNRVQPLLHNTAAWRASQRLAEEPGLGELLVRLSGSDSPSYTRRLCRQPRHCRHSHKGVTDSFLTRWGAPRSKTVSARCTRL